MADKFLHPQTGGKFDGITGAVVLARECAAALKSDNI
jgi:hypothetical protein